jgi:(p)ppGpp synthase/HD superfamily hydrolase
VSDLRLNGRAALTNAIMVACTAHAHQRDLGGEHAILHSLRVMQTVEPQTDEYRIAAVLHDVTEGNTGIDLGDLRDYRLSETIIAALDALRRRDGESYYDYIGRVCENQIACAVKRADLAHNMDMTRLGREPNAKDEARFQQYEAAWLRVLRCQRDKGWVAG